jgi:hypothetical protein
MGRDKTTPFAYKARKNVKLSEACDLIMEQYAITLGIRETLAN